MFEFLKNVLVSSVNIYEALKHRRIVTWGQWVGGEKQGITNKTSKIVIIEYDIRVKLITITCRIKEGLTLSRYPRT